MTVGLYVMDHIYKPTYIREQHVYICMYTTHFEKIQGQHLNDIYSNLDNKDYLHSHIYI